MTAETLQNRITTWANDRMPNRDIPSRLRKLGEEHGELSEAVTRYLLNPTSANKLKAGIEAADMALVLMDTLAMMDMNLLKCMLIKMDVIEKRPIEALKKRDRA